MVNSVGTRSLLCAVHRPGQSDLAAEPQGLVKIPGGRCEELGGTGAVAIAGRLAQRAVLPVSHPHVSFGLAEEPSQLEARENAPRVGIVPDAARVSGNGQDVGLRLHELNHFGLIWK